jgi:hypothetical protein
MTNGKAQEAGVAALVLLAVVTPNLVLRHCDRFDRTVHYMSAVSGFRSKEYRLFNICKDAGRCPRSLRKTPMGEKWIVKELGDLTSSRWLGRNHPPDQIEKQLTPLVEFWSTRLLGLLYIKER